VGHISGYILFQPLVETHRLAAVRRRFEVSFGLICNTTLSVQVRLQKSNPISKCNLSYLYPIINIVAIVICHPYNSSR